MGVGVVIISYKAISVQSIEIEFGLTGTELGKIKLFKQILKLSFDLENWFLKNVQKLES